MERMTEKEFARARDRYHELVDKKFGPGLTDAEESELKQLGAAIDDHFTPYYEQVLANVEAMEVRARKTLDGEKHENQR